MSGALVAAPVDEVGQDAVVIPVEFGLKSSPLIRCGVYRCGVGGTFIFKPAVIAFHPQADPDPLEV